MSRWTTAAVSRWATLGVAIVMVSSLGTSAGADDADPPADAPAPLSTPSPAGVTTVGLITGDRVTLETFRDGGYGIDVELADRGDDDVTYAVHDENGQVYVIPSDTTALIPDVLDRELFNVTKLAEYGYDLDHGLPVIATPGAEDLTAHRLTTPKVTDLAGVPGVTSSLELSSVSGVAATVDGGKPAFWRSLKQSRTAPSTLAADDRLAPVGKIWLDEQVEVSLNESVPAIGAPEAWDSGYDGSGLTVAVLDTGVDATHPGISDQVVATENFSRSSTAGDRHGHGTHVASIIAGTGAEGDEPYIGVAPGADLISGKVLGDGGTGPQSWTIAGMEWAVAAGADIVNMSLGTSFASSGNDIASRAVNRLTAEHDVLFVTSAGNTGPGAWTIGSPGAASAALTVGAVDNSGNMPSWSSRGPRVGDHAVKPDITAPGVGIVAASASGTSIGTPVNENYTSLSGTSMSAPHVAGAAAIMLNKHPGMSAGELKAALTTTASRHEDLTVYQQGGGRVDVPAALDADLMVSESSLSLGRFAHPYDDTEPVDVDVTYTNRSDQQLNLDLSLEATGGRPVVEASDAALTVTPSHLDLAAGESATVTVTLDVRDENFGIYSGYLSAADESGSVISHVAAGFTLQAPTHTLTIEGVDRNGEPADGQSAVDVMNGHDLNAFNAWRLFNVDDGTVTLEVPEGMYSIVGQLHNAHPEFGQERSVVAAPEVSVTDDTTIVLDARDANRIDVETPEHDARPLANVPVTYGFKRQSASGQSVSVVQTASPAWAIYASETDAVSVGEFELFSRWLLGTPDGSVLYDLALVEPDGVPENLHYVARPDELAAVANSYHSDASGQVMRSRRYVEMAGWDDPELSVYEELNVPVERTEYYVPGDVSHRRRLQFSAGSSPVIETAPRSYRAGEREARSWFARPIRPSVVEGGRNYRKGNTLHVSTSAWVDADRNHTDEGAEFEYYIDGDLRSRGSDPSRLPMASDPAEYRLELSSQLQKPWWQTSTSARTSWSWASQPSAGNGIDMAPFILLDYDLEIDMSNSAVPPDGVRGKPTVGVHARHLADAGAVEGVRVWISYDDGARWRERPVRDVGDGRYEAILDNRDRAGRDTWASLKVEAWDADGNRVEQEIVRAFAPASHVPEPDPGPASTELVSVATDGSMANGGSSAPPAISADGRYVAFTSWATNLVPGNPGLSSGVYVRDRKTGSTEHVSVSSDGSAADGAFGTPAISPDGRYVTFSSTSTDLVPNKTTTGWDAYVHDRESGVTERVSVADDGTEGDAGASSSPPAISADGRLVAFAGYATNLVPDDTNNSQDVFVRDREAGTTQRVSVSSDGAETGRFRSSSDPVISADGRYVGFLSSGSSLVPDDTNNARDAFVHDLQNATTERVSLGADGAQANGWTSGVAMSADGRHIAFASTASNLVADDTNGTQDVFVRDRDLGATERVSLSSGGAQTNGYTTAPAISPDGRHVGFASGATNLVANDGNDEWDTFAHDRTTDVTERVSISTDGAEGNDSSGSSPAFSAGGEFVAFVSSAPNLVLGDTNLENDVFVRHRALP